MLRGAGVAEVWWWREDEREGRAQSLTRLHIPLGQMLLRFVSLVLNSSGSASRKASESMYHTGTRELRELVCHGHLRGAARIGQSTPHWPCGRTTASQGASGDGDGEVRSEKAGAWEKRCEGKEGVEGERYSELASGPRCAVPHRWESPSSEGTNLRRVFGLCLC